MIQGGITRVCVCYKGCVGVGVTRGVIQGCVGGCYKGGVLQGYVCVTKRGGYYSGGGGGGSVTKGV